MLDRAGQFLAGTMRMDDKTWARHANPWSVWTRVPLGTLLLLAIWSHVLIGWFWALVLLMVLVVWTYFNPRVFPEPANRDTWSFRGTSGERLWLDRKTNPIPRHQERVAGLLAIAGGVFFAIGLIAAIWGDLAWTLLGAVTSTLAKMWFVDRMAWLYDDMDGSLEAGMPQARHSKTQPGAGTEGTT